MANRLLLLLVATILTFVFLGEQAVWAQEISSDRIKTAVVDLASDRMEGRGPGTRGEILATEFIAEEFKKAGLKPLGKGDTYFQPVPLVRVLTRNNPAPVFRSYSISNFEIRAPTRARSPVTARPVATHFAFQRSNSSPLAVSQTRT